MVGRLSDIMASPKPAKISGGMGLAPMVNDLRTSSTELAAKAATGGPEQSANTGRTRSIVFISSMTKVSRQNSAKRPRVGFDHGMDIVDLPASSLPDEVIANLVLSLRFTHPIVRREHSDNARARGVLRECLDRNHGRAWTTMLSLVWRYGSGQARVAGRSAGNNELTREAIAAQLKIGVASVYWVLKAQSVARRSRFAGVV